MFSYKFRSAILAVVIVSFLTIFSNDLWAVGNPLPTTKPHCGLSTYCGEDLTWMVDTLTVVPDVCPTCEIRVIYRYVELICPNSGEYFFACDIFTIIVPETCWSDCGAGYEYPYYFNVAMNAFYEIVMEPRQLILQNIYDDEGVIYFSTAGCEIFARTDYIGPDISPGVGSVSLNLNLFNEPLPESYVGGSGYILLLPDLDNCGDVCCLSIFDDGEWTHDYSGFCNEAPQPQHQCVATCNHYHDMLENAYGQPGYEYSDFWKRATTTINENIRIYPNPATDIITVQIGEYTGKEYNILITDVNGKPLISEKYSGTNIEINTSSYSSGTYIITVYDANNLPVHVEKVIIQK